MRLFAIAAAGAHCVAAQAQVPHILGTWELDAETAIDSHTVEWTDKADGRVIASGRKWVSQDGQTLSFTVDVIDESGENIEYLFIYDRTSP